MRQHDLAYTGYLTYTAYFGYNMLYQGEKPLNMRKEQNNVNVGCAGCDKCISGGIIC